MSDEPPSLWTRNSDHPAPPHPRLSPVPSTFRPLLRQLPPTPHLQTQEQYEKLKRNRTGPAAALRATWDLAEGGGSSPSSGSQQWLTVSSAEFQMVNRKPLSSQADLKFSLGVDGGEGGGGSFLLNSTNSEKYHYHV